VDTAIHMPANRQAKRNPGPERGIASPGGGTWQRAVESELSIAA